MASLAQALLNKSLATHKVGSVVDDTAVALRLKYIGTGTVTSVTVTTATNIVNVTSDGGTDTYAFSAYTTLGTLADAINADGIFEARILDGLRTDSTDSSELVNGAKTITSLGYYDILSDTSVLKAISYRAAVDRGVRANRPAGGHRVHVQEIDYNVNLGATLSNNVQVWEWDSVAKTETQVLTRAAADATATQVNWASGEGMISSGWGNELLVRITNTNSVTDDDANYLNVSYIVE